VQHRPRHSRARHRGTPGGAGRPRSGVNRPDLDATQRIPRHRPSRLASPGRLATARRLLIGAQRSVLALLSVAVLTGTGYGWASLQELEHNLNTTDVIRAEPPGAPGDGATDILLVGSDSRTDANGNPLPLDVLKLLRTEESAGLNTDTIILIRVPESGGNAHAVSVPRDTYVPIPGYRHDKINATYGVTKRLARDRLRAEGATDERQIERGSNQAGQLALVGVVEELTGVKIDHYAEVNLLGFYLLTEAIGGVVVCLKRATKDPDSGADFRKGRQLVRGGDALAFVRQRNNLPRGDLDRIVRQQVFMAALANRMLAAGTLTDPGRLSGLADAVQRSVVLDDGWDVLAFASQLQGLAGGDLEFVTIPVVEVGARNERGQSIITVDPTEVRAFAAGLLHDRTVTAAAATPAQGQPAGTQPTTPTAPGPDRAAVIVSVLNATNRSGLATRVQGVLAAAGFRTGAADNATSRQDRTEVFVAPGARAAGEQVAATLGGHLTIVEDPQQPADRVKIVLGADYFGAGAHSLAAPGMIRLDGTALLAQPAAPSAPPSTAPTRPGQPADDDAPITAGGITCVN